VDVNEAVQKIHGICARLLYEAEDSPTWHRYRSELQAAARDLGAEEKAWNEPSEPDVHQGEARQSYRSRETDSADGFAEGLKLFNPKRPDSQKKKD
jgi:hypothetical protein